MEAAFAVKEDRRERSKRRRPKRRGIVGQRRRREGERRVRSMAVALLRWALQKGKTVHESANRLLLSPFTLREWQRRWGCDKMAVKELGRPPERGEVKQRELVFALFGLLGPGVGVPTLRSLLPDMPRRELEEIKERYTRIFKAKNRVTYRVLNWTRPGAVWAMDHTWPPMDVDGQFDRLLLVRDLSSRNILSSLPVEGEDSETVIHLLSALFAWYGTPLVIKSDNGSAFTSDETRRFFRDNGVYLLLSPPGTPKFNGSCEAGCGAVKLYSFHEAARNDRPYAWTPDDVEAGRCRSNIIPRQDDPGERTPDRLFEMRRPVTPGERAAFHFATHHHNREARKELGYLPEIELPIKDQDRIDRLALSRALVEQGFLFFRRRRITPVISRRKFARISKG
ncbi:MAG: DDE-type integrase/transposase/recombinase [Planctomycetota bacterium]